MNPATIRFSIDRGGTFTDVYAEIAAWGKVYTEKLLSEDPAHYSDAPREGIRRILEEVYRITLPPALPLASEGIEWIRMGTTVATNALLERTGADTALIISKGFGDLLAIGDQTRPDLFDLRIIKPDLLYKAVLEVDGRVRPLQAGEENDGPDTIIGTSGEAFRLLKRPDPELIRDELEKIYATGIRSVAIVCMHAYSVYQHELFLADIAEKIGFSQISLSHQVMPQVKIVARGDTCLVDAYLTPHIRRYLDSFQTGFVDNLNNCPLLFMQSDGGLTAAHGFKGSNAILSGPAGGVVGCALTTYPETEQRPVIGFDMGGTSTDISRYNGSYELVQETKTAGVRIQAPQMHIKTVAAGGGSRLLYRNGMLQVGPESAGAHPGPLCYRKQGYLAVTDANLFLGRIQADFFPHIFGPDENQALDRERVRQAFYNLTAQVNEDALKLGIAAKTPEEVALGFLEVANETMIRPIREISVMRGYDIKEHVLSCFGGAGGQHACAVATALGINTVFIHHHAGILSALGLSLAETVVDSQEAAAEILNKTSLPRLLTRLDGLEKRALKKFHQQCSHAPAPHTIRYLNLRFQGTDTAMMVAVEDEQDPATIFCQQYLQEYGFLLSDRDILVDNIRVRLTGQESSLARPLVTCNSDTAIPLRNVVCYFHEGLLSTPLYLLEDIPPGKTLTGPAIIIQEGSTILLEPKSLARRTRYGDIIIEFSTEKFKQISKTVDPVQLSIFSNLFMSIGEQMGRTLQKSAISTNIKERLDFSCAVFDGKGDLVANAPHIPVHLGAMGEAVKSQIALHQGTLRQGEVLTSNHPAAGGSHLPDITVITPVWNNKKIVFFVASRGHHADIGGISPGSMPPFSTSLVEEGAAIRTLKIVKDGLFQEDAVLKFLTAFADAGHTPPIAPACHPADNLSDLKAQIAANQNGVRLLEEMMEKYGLEVVQAYMGHIQDNAERAVRRMLKELCRKTGRNDTLELLGEDFLDDGTPIRLRITIVPENGSATFDFSGSGKQLAGNLNCPPAVVHSAILYSLRCLIGEEIPLNQGCLNPISVLVEKGSLLNPAEDAAVVGGNVLTSQRITDVIFKAFAAAADSQGCTNNLTFGNEHFGYYETIGGGAGAGPGWDGQSGVHTHMTNTRITDPEILERRYPVLLREFSLRKGSGGNGQYRGGDGLVRDIEALAPLQVSILSERRVLSPNGLAGGENGKRGKNSIVRDGKTIDIGGKNSVFLNKGDSIRIETPGGGGYGKVINEE
ncbi:MAG: hydantoinase B/oxoprolinase family protein [Proteobacteria bacterium]|nr:hydantoinase B/oxoprolinase family protein [Pseudomonadota bacterium]MBU1057997.1 hydantoinase B/oxoprolinase family protein [Pseudomonadota bacterium]